MTDRTRHGASAFDRTRAHDRTRFDRTELDDRTLTTAEAAALVSLGRELAALDAGPDPRPVAFTGRVMSAIGSEATPRPARAAIAAARARRPFAVLGAGGDALRVPFGAA